MGRIRRSYAIGIAAACAAMAVTAAPAAQADELVPTRSVLLLTVSMPHLSTVVDHYRVLECSPTGGTHPAAADACADLDYANGDFRAVAKDDRGCPMIYAPVTVSAQGWWHGRRTGTVQTFANTCVLRAETGAVFAF
ncbi:Subtilisin inhibitor-like [Amycolatopsis xylanica]|uniref:Subtilisin inhibitor-like n=1 Tax=Amycolatopsis xylanica TaxID=589385 RepID=A0A1H2T182_9PSEU|nr:SSI family serine proteinase inhibitor [Amycolatopsis xylanica]SDW37611.1 Subtilisin inhibitor-like [Amycolatopsis xylanica]